MLPPIMIIILAWGIAHICDGEHLKTANYLTSLIENRISATWLPLIAFLLAGITSFSTGSSWSTMNLLIPLIIPVTIELLVADGLTISAHHPVLLNVIGSILAGSIFGDHCSPISDTTVLSSAASQCDHMKHVTTQIPYALAAGMICVIGAYIPIAFGLPLWQACVLCAVLVVGVIFLLGRTPKSQDTQ